MIKLILIGISLLLIIPSIIALVLSLTSRGIRGVSVGLWSAFRLVARLGKYLIIPVASFVLLAPDSWRSILPNSGTSIGILILIVASLVLLMEMFKGLGSALAISFWAGLCLIILGAFQLDKVLPKDLSMRFGSIDQQIAALAKHAPSRSVAAPPTSQQRSHDGLEFSDFSMDRLEPVQVTARAPFQLPDLGFDNIEETVSETLTPAFGAFGLGRDQSISALPSEIYFSPKTPKRQYFGLAKSGEETELGIAGLSFLDPSGGYLSKFLEK